MCHTGKGTSGAGIIRHCYGTECQHTLVFRLTVLTTPPCIRLYRLSVLTTPPCIRLYRLSAVNMDLMHTAEN